MSNRRFCARPGAYSIVLQAAGPDSSGCFGCLHGVETGSIVKKRVPIDSNAFIWNMRTARRVAAASIALPANICATPIKRLR